jgi:hypothetical protein
VGIILVIYKNKYFFFPVGNNLQPALLLDQNEPEWYLPAHLVVLERKILRSLNCL